MFSETPGILDVEIIRKRSESGFPLKTSNEYLNYLIGQDAASWKISKIYLAERIIKPYAGNSAENGGEHMKIIGIIPARMASSRYPGKPLAKDPRYPDDRPCVLPEQDVGSYERSIYRNLRRGDHGLCRIDRCTRGDDQCIP